jgi:acetyl-CoA carboxylase, biotin carboxylase subunit
MIKRLFIANRGEIAVRVIRACKELNITSIAVYSEADKTALHTRLADEAYYIGGAPASESYLNKNKILELAKKVKADAIHPGYGFFSENADFIQLVEEAGIIFIGPSSTSVKMMGSKTAARQLMKKNGVPIVPGTTEPIKSLASAKEIAKEISYPILLKASAGGGGKGMRKVEEEKELEGAFESTQREAEKAFGDAAIYIEKYIENPKHIEVQIMGDKEGNYVHLFERECSVQRRHQKIIEEAPSASVDEITRQKITNAAIDAAKACGYYNAGTIEFLMDREKNFYFLEMNTRLQVEHPVTEMISGIDLVKEQINVANGNKLSFNQEDLKINGHSVECRVYAEDADNNFLPSTGTLYEYKTPSGPGVRIDSGYERGSVIPINYDPLIAKLVTNSDTREGALNRMKRALEEFHISGCITNLAYLKRIIENEKFISGEFDINFIEKEGENLLKNENEEGERVAAILSVLIKNQKRKETANGKKGGNNKWKELMYE